MIGDITGDGPVQTAVQIAFDIFGGGEEVSAVVGYLELHPDDAVAVLRALEAIERRRKPSVASVPRITAADIAASMRDKPRWPKRAWRTVPKGWIKRRATATLS